MLHRIITYWNNVFAPRDWELSRDAKARSWIMRRWRGGAWEYRDPTPEEAYEAHAFWAIK